MDNMGIEQIAGFLENGATFKGHLMVFQRLSRYPYMFGIVSLDHISRSNLVILITYPIIL